MLCILTSSFKLIKLYVIPFLYWKNLRLKISGVEIHFAIIENSCCWVTGLVEKFPKRDWFLTTNLAAVIYKRFIVIIFSSSLRKLLVNIFIWNFGSKSVYSILRDYRIFIYINNNKCKLFKVFETPTSAGHSIYIYPFHQIDCSHLTQNC